MRHPSVDRSDIGSQNFGAGEMVESRFFVSVLHWASARIAVLKKNGPRFGILPVVEHFYHIFSFGERKRGQIAAVGRPVYHCEYMIVPAFLFLYVFVEERSCEHGAQLLLVFDVTMWPPRMRETLLPEWALVVRGRVWSLQHSPANASILMFIFASGERLSRGVSSS